MKSLREAEEDEIRSLPLLTRDGRSGPVFTTRTDAADFPRNPSSLATSLGKTSVSYGSPEYQDKDSDVIFTPEAAAILKATESRTRSLARTGVIPAFKIGKKEWRYSRTSLKEWVQEQVKGSRNATGAITESSTAKRPAKRTAVQRRKQIPTDLSPEALRKAMQSIRLNGK
jgi:excisionase family DNA binding protein